MTAAMSETVADVALETGAQLRIVLRIVLRVQRRWGRGRQRRRDCGDGGGVRGGHGAGAAMARDDSESRHPAGLWERRVTGRSTRPGTRIHAGNRRRK